MVLSLNRRCSEQRGMQRWLPVVDTPLSYQPEELVDIQQYRIGIDGRLVDAGHVECEPRPGPQEVLARNRGEGGLQTRVSDPCRGQGLLRIGPAHNGKIRLMVHCDALLLSSDERLCAAGRSARTRKNYFSLTCPRTPRKSA